MILNNQYLCSATPYSRRHEQQNHSFHYSLV